MEMLLDSTLASLLDELSAFGTAYDGDEAHRPARMLNITPDTGAFLAVLVKAMGARSILEVGTSNGYSTLWLADAVGSTGSVTTVELAPAKAAMARANFARANRSNAPSFWQAWTMAHSTCCSSTRCAAPISRGGRT
jgi:predicted O-methyltransferase YrrM